MHELSFNVCAKVNDEEEESNEKEFRQHSHFDKTILHTNITAAR